MRNNRFHLDKSKVKGQISEIERIKEIENQRIIKQELRRALRRDTEEDRRYNSLKKDAQEFLRKDGMRNPISGHVALASVIDLDDYNIKTHINEGMYTNIEFKRKLVEELEKYEEKHTTSNFSAENFMIGEIIRMMKEKDYKSDLKQEFLEEETFDFKKAVDYIHKTESLNKGLNLLQKNTVDQYRYMKKNSLSTDQMNLKVVKELLYYVRANMWQEAEAILEKFPELKKWNDNVKNFFYSLYS